MEEFLSHFVIDTIGIIILSALLFFMLIQLFFYLSYYRKPSFEYQNSDNNVEDTSELPSVSVIIVAKNDSENLEKMLPCILNQQYPDYQVVVVNDGSTDETDLLLKNLKAEHSHLYSTFSPISYDNDPRRQKILALTIGIKAATKDVLLFTEVDSFPMDSQHWIASMMCNLTPDKDIVLGFCNYSANNSFWSEIALFDNLLFSLQYSSMTLKRKPFIGTYRNLAYRKKIFFENKGFSSSLMYNKAEEIFLNNIMNSNNTAIALDKSSFVTCHLRSFSMWRHIKYSYMMAKKYLHNFNPQIFHLESFSRYLFYALFISIVSYTTIMQLWVYLSVAVLIFIIRFLVQFFVLRTASNYFGTRNFILSLPILDILQPYYNSYFRKYSNKKQKNKL